MKNKKLKKKNKKFFVFHLSQRLYRAKNINLFLIKSPKKRQNYVLLFQLTGY